MPEINITWRGLSVGVPDVEASVVLMLGDEENLVVVNVVAVGWLLLHVHLVFRRPEELVPKMCHALHVDKFIVGSILVTYICTTYNTCD